MSKTVELQFQVEKDVFEALNLIKAVGDFLILANSPDTPALLEGTLSSFGNLLIDKAAQVAKVFGLD